MTREGYIGFAVKEEIKEWVLSKGFDNVPSFLRYLKRQEENSAKSQETPYQSNKNNGLNPMRPTDQYLPISLAIASGLELAIA